MRLYSVIFARFVCLCCSALAAHNVCITKIHSVDCVEQSELGAVVCHIVSVVVRPPRVIDTRLNRPLFVRHLFLVDIKPFSFVAQFLSAFIYFVRVNDALCCGHFNCMKIGSIIHRTNY